MTTIKFASSFISIGIAALIGSQSALANTQETRIIGGKEAAAGEFPWQVALLSNPNNAYQSQYCGGTLIDASWVLTAAHCVYDTPDSEPIYIAAGITSLTSTRHAQIRLATKRVVHKLYNPFTLNNDIALLQLETPIDLDACGYRCQIIDPVTQDEATSYEPSVTAYVSGWGNTSRTSYDFPAQLQWADVSIMDCTGAPSLYNNSEITSNMLCAATPGTGWDKDSCQGDSGGPLVVSSQDGTGTFKLAGIVSWGNGCAMQGYPGVYTKVANYTRWIETRGGSMDLFLGGLLLGFGWLRSQRKPKD